MVKAVGIFYFSGVGYSSKFNIMKSKLLVLFVSFCSVLSAQVVTKYDTINVNNRGEEEGLVHVKSVEYYNKHKTNGVTILKNDGERFNLSDSVLKVESIHYLRMNMGYEGSLRSDSARIDLDSIKIFLDKNPKINIQIEQYTDSRGHFEFNQKLSQRRAEIQAAYLISKGIHSNRIIAKGFGENVLLVSDMEISSLKTLEEREQAHAKNRRCLIRIISIQ
jgi:hypothetical protein